MLAYPAAELATRQPFPLPRPEVLYALLAVTGCAEFYALYLGLLDSAGLSSTSRVPGDLKFDPLGMLPVEKFGKIRMLSSELKHGRLAMLGVAGMVAAEMVHGDAVVNLTPAFFQPFWADW